MWVRIMAIDWQRPEYRDAKPDWVLIDKVCDEVDLGSLLPAINAHDTSEANKTRNEFYRERASWFGASQLTLSGLIGIAFDDAPEIELPAVLEYLRSNCDGEGVDLQQQMQAATGQGLRKGRAGLFVTYPEREGDTSRADQIEGRAVATIHLIDAARIINWWHVKQGAQTLLGGVVFTDTRSEVVDYEVTETPLLRELAIVDGVFVDRVWVQQEKSGNWMVESERMPKDASGAPWRVIPFVFLGAVDNTARVDRPPMLSLARLNRDHYRNSADNEESVWFAGQAQPYLENTDVTMEDLNAAKENGFYLGSRMMIIGKLGFAQADPNSAVRQAMIDKIEAMKAMGARFIMPGTVAKTATQDSGEQRVQHSILSLVVSNVEDAYNAALRFVSQYMNAQEAYVTLPRGFMDPEVTPELIDRVIALWDRSLIGTDEVLPILKRAKVAAEDKDPEEYGEEVEARGGMIDPVAAE